MGVKAYREARNIALWASQTFPYANIQLKIPTVLSAVSLLKKMDSETSAHRYWAP